MNVFVVAAESSPDSRLAVQALRAGGKALTSVAWIVPWDGGANSLCLKLQPYSDSGLVVCSINDDWSYRVQHRGRIWSSIPFPPRNRI
jgi:hypothetical protein